MIPHNKPTIGKEEIAAVAKVLRSGWIAEGKKVEEFENAVCRYIGIAKGSAVAVSSGTAALYLALLSLDIGKGKEVIIPTYVCSAVLHAVTQTGARPVLVDVDLGNLNSSFDEVRKKITPQTAAIILTHTYGMPADSARFSSLSVPIIEDSAQAIGARIRGRHVGLAGKAATFSFYASKMITTGYGGMIVSEDKNLIEKVRDYRQFDYREDYKQRFNFHLSDIQAAMGLVQLKRLPSFLKKRAHIAATYKKALPKLTLWSTATKEMKPNLYRILLRTKHAGDLKRHLESKGIKTIIPLERFELLHRQLGLDPENFPESEKIVEETLSLPAYPSLPLSEAKKIARAIEEYFEGV